MKHIPLGLHPMYLHLTPFHPTISTLLKIRHPQHSPTIVSLEINLNQKIIIREYGHVHDKVKTTHNE
jgi:hypothetical protein